MPSKQTVLETYFESLERGEFRHAAEQFTADVTYIHPPMYGDKTHIEGRDELYSYFADIRGEQDVDHHVTRFVANGNTCAAVGYVTDSNGGDPQDYFVSYAEFDGSSIAYYIAGLLGMSELS